MNQPSMWYLKIGKVTKGPFSLSDILQFYRARAIKKDTMIWRKGLPNWIPLSASGILNHVSGLFSKSLITTIVVFVLLLTSGLFGLHMWQDAHRLDGAWQGRNAINNTVTLYFQPNQNANFLYAKSELDDKTSSFEYTVKQLSGNSIEVDYFDYAMRDGAITGNSDQARKYIITFTGDNTAEIDGCGGVTNISKIEDQRAKAILGLS